MPGEPDGEVLRVQDEYLRQRILENGIVGLSDIPELREGLSIWQGDITRLAVDAIVNAANSQMLGCFVPMHACIDNCIHTFAGVQLRAECHRQMNLLRSRYGPDYEQPTSIPMLTDAYNLPAKKIVHIVGPIVQGALTPEQFMKLKNMLSNYEDSRLWRAKGTFLLTTGQRKRLDLTFGDLFTEEFSLEAGASENLKENRPAGELVLIGPGVDRNMGERLFYLP